MSGHVPAWKRIAIKKANNEPTLIADDPLNVTVHLATGNLNKKEKRQIINGTTSRQTKGKVSKAEKKGRKKVKLPKAERSILKTKVLKDQLKYLIEFYRNKCNKALPKQLLDLDSVALKYEDKEDEADSGIQELWKFSKQKQNWLIKHFLSLEEIPREYDELLVTYFEGLQGRARSEIKEKCLKSITQWNNYVDAEDQKIKQIVNGDAEKINQADLSHERPSNNGNEKTNTDEIKANAAERDQELIQLPPKDLIFRSYKILKSWLKSDEDLTESHISLKSLDLE